VTLVYAYIMKSNINILIFSLTVLIGGFLVTSSASIVRPPNNLGLVGYWSMDEGVGLQAGDMSGNGNDGTILGSPTWTTGKRGKALSFNGSSYTSVIDNSSLNMDSSNFALSFWFKNTVSLGSSFWNIVSKKNAFNSTNAGWMMWFRNNGGEGLGLSFRMNSGQVNDTVIGSTVDVSSKISDGVWHHVVVIINRSSNTASFYFDGDDIGSSGSVIAGSFSNTDSLGIGASGVGNEKVPSGFTLDDVRIYNRALSAPDVYKLYSGGVATRKGLSDSDLIGYWSLNEGAGTQAQDGSTQKNDATFVNGPTWAQGKRNGAVQFTSASSQYLSPKTILISEADMFSKGLTLSAWIKTSNSSDQGIIGQSSSMSYSIFSNGGIYVDSGQPRMVAYEPGDNYYSALAGTNVADNKWHHVAGTFSASDQKMRIYIDGVLEDTSTHVFVDMPVPTYAVIGAVLKDTNPQYFDGLIDDVRAYDRALTATEISKLYEETEGTFNSSQNNQLTDGLVGMWSFNGPDVSGSTVYDRSGSGNNGTITGANPTIGKVGQALNFDGSDYINVGNDASLNITDAITVSLWVKPNSSSGQQGLVSDSAGWSNHFHMYLRDGADAQYAWGISNAEYFRTGNMKVGEWQHIVGTYSEVTSEAFLYVDGESIASGNWTGEIVTTINDLYLGRAPGIAVPVTLNGSIDEVRIYDRALSADEVKQLYLMGN